MVGLLTQGEPFANFEGCDHTPCISTIPKIYTF